MGSVVRYNYGANGFRAMEGIMINGHSDFLELTPAGFRELGFDGLKTAIVSFGECDPDFKIEFIRNGESELIILKFFVMVNGGNGYIMTTGEPGMVGGELVVGTAERPSFCTSIEEVIEAVFAAAIDFEG